MPKAKSTKSKANGASLKSAPSNKHKTFVIAGVIALVAIVGGIFTYTSFAAGSYYGHLYSASGGVRIEGCVKSVFGPYGHIKEVKFRGNGKGLYNISTKRGNTTIDNGNLNGWFTTTKVNASNDLNDRVVISSGGRDVATWYARDIKAPRFPNCDGSWSK